LEGSDGPAIETEYEEVLDLVVDIDILEDITANPRPEAKGPGVEVANPLDINIPYGVVVDLEPKAEGSGV